MKKYLTEREGQIDFFDNYRIDYKSNPVLIDNTDGVFNGCLFEFKLEISDLNKTLFQAIKYLSHMRIKGNSVPVKYGTPILINIANSIAVTSNTGSVTDFNTKSIITKMTAIDV